MSAKFPTYYFRFIKRTMPIDDGLGSGDGVYTKNILQQLWVESGWHGTEPTNDESWRPAGEWRDVPLEGE